MRILSRMMAFAFDKLDDQSTIRAIECAQCFKDPHSILQPIDGEETDLYGWQSQHGASTGHSEYRIYELKIRRSRTALMPVDE